MFELNTYGRILYSTNRKEEAITVFDLNTKLFPDQPRTYMSLANTLGLLENVKKQLQFLKKPLNYFQKTKIY